MVSPKKIFYNPSEGFCGDYIPAWYDGRWQLFYIHGRDWEHLATDDFVTFDELPKAVYSGGDDAQDCDIYTGCVVKHDGVVHIFYTGNNNNFPAQGKPQQVTMHATSRDGVHFTKDPAFWYEPDTPEYLNTTWRDPHVFWNEEENCWWMILTAAKNGPVTRHWGCTYLMTSDDLTHWTKQGPVYAPDAYDTHECADMFRMGDWWYLIYSTYSKLWETRYRMARSPRGPWLTPKRDVLAGRGFYAAKTVTDGRVRHLVGWACRKEKEQDTNPYEWGGCLCVLTVSQNPDGTLALALPDTVRAQFAQPVLIPASEAFERVSAFTLRPLAQTGESFRLHAAVENLRPDATFENRVGLYFYADAAYEHYVQLNFDCNAGRVTVERSSGYFFGSRLPDEILEADLSGRFDVELTVYGTLCVLTVGGNSLVFRCYEHRSGTLGLFAADSASARFTGLSLSSAE